MISIVLAKQKPGNQRDNTKTPKQDNSNKTWEPIENKSDSPDNMAMQHSKPWDHAVNTPGNPGLVYMQNDHHVDYDRRNNSGSSEHEPMQNEYHVDYDRRYYSGNTEHVLVEQVARRTATPKNELHRDKRDNISWSSFSPNNYMYNESYSGPISQYKHIPLRLTSRYNLPYSYDHHINYQNNWNNI